VWLTRAPTFLEKAALFPGTTFVVGCDTADRLVEPRYYGGSEEQMRQALRQLQAAGCPFLVAGRGDQAGAFPPLEHVRVPEGVAALFAAIPESTFGVDLSSTRLRQGGTSS